MSGKILLIFFVSAAIFMLAATYRFHDSAHAMGMIKKGGGMARHPALLDKDRDSYVLIATAGVVPPYQGNARVVLEGDPTLTATFHNSEPALDLGFHRHPEFRNNTYYDLRPRDRIALWVKIKRTRSLQDRKQAAIALNQKRMRGALPPCTQCEPEIKGADTVASEQGEHARPSAKSEPPPLRPSMPGSRELRGKVVVRAMQPNQEADGAAKVPVRCRQRARQWHSMMLPRTNRS